MEIIRYILRERSPLEQCYVTSVETEGINAEVSEDLNHKAPWFTYQLALLSPHTILFVTQNYSDGPMSGRTTTPLRAIAAGVEVLESLHDAAIEYLESMKMDIREGIRVDIIDRTRFSKNQGLETVASQ